METMGSVPTSVLVSFLLTGLVLVGWMVFGFIQYKRTGKGTWLWLGVLMGVSLISGFLSYARFYG
jgi:hypothetical protein